MDHWNILVFVEENIIDWREMSEIQIWKTNAKKRYGLKYGQICDNLEV